MLDIPWDGGPRRDLVVAGVDIGGTKVTAVLAGADGVILASGTTASGQGGQALIEAAAGLIARLESESGLRAVSVGAGAAGVIDPRTARCSPRPATSPTGRAAVPPRPSPSGSAGR